MNNKPKYTDEQSEILKAKVNKSQVIVVKAYAGTGKTFILVEWAKLLKASYPSIKILYVAFNKPIVVSAAQRFGQLADCKTFHGLSMGRCGRPYAQSGRLPRHPKKYRKEMLFSPLNDWLAAELADLEDYPDEANPEITYWKTRQPDLSSIGWDVVHTVFDTLERFMNSSDPKITADHVPEERLADTLCPKPAIISMARNVWKRMADTRDTISVPHGVYLKKYQLEQHDLGKIYDVILFDEAQDGNPVQLDIVNRANSAKILVGDSHQQIYEWRGTVNTLDTVKATQTYTLSQSFRFGDSVARYASQILRTWKNEDREVLGTGSGDAVTTDEWLLNSGLRYAYLARTNASLFTKGLECLENGVSYSFIHGFKQEWTGKLLDVYYVCVGTPHRCFEAAMRKQDLATLKRFAHAAEDLDTIALISLVSKHGDKIPAYLKELEENSIDEKLAGEQAHVILSTGHKAKGLEWDNVVLDPDFSRSLACLYDKEAKAEDRIPVSDKSFFKIEEANLVYVAFTRAQKILGAPKNLIQFIHDMEVYKQEVLQNA